MIGSRVIVEAETAIHIAVAASIGQAIPLRALAAGVLALAVLPGHGRPTTAAGERSSVQ